MNKNIEIIAMVYKSVEYFGLITTEISHTIKNNNTDWAITSRVIGNDPAPKLIDYLLPENIYTDPHPDEHYLKRVYRCWNWAGMGSTADNICFVNSDMIFSDGWLANLLKHHDGHNIPCSRLVESGKLNPADAAIKKDFGRTPTTLRRKKWELFARQVSEDRVAYGGLFMPCVFETQRFRQSGGYPEGNMVVGYNHYHGHDVIMPGDRYLFNRLSLRFEMRHITVCDSVVYHIQEGEMDAP